MPADTANEKTRDVDSQTARAFLGIREYVLRGEFTRRERISEVRLSERLQVSRTPVRMALERLAHLGLLDIGAKGGFFVREFTVDDVRDAIEVRAVLEGTAARLAAERLDDESELDDLSGLCDETEGFSELSVSSFEHYMDRNETFHSTILDLAKSPMLRRMVEQASSLPFASPSAMVFSTSMLDSSERTLAFAQEQHRNLVEAIRNREGTRAEFLGREHARIGWTSFERVLSNQHLLDSVPGGALINISES